MNSFLEPVVLICEMSLSDRHGREHCSDILLILQQSAKMQDSYHLVTVKPGLPYYPGCLINQKTPLAADLMLLFLKWALRPLRGFLVSWPEGIRQEIGLG